MRFNRAILIVLDSVGVGELPDAAEYGDEGSNTVQSIINTVGLNVPNMASLGLSKLVTGIDSKEITGSYGKMAEKSPGKDTVTGHWEITGLILEKPFPTYPEGFPDELIKEFTEKIGIGVLCNKPYSGTEVINKFGDEHIRTGKPIVYTSADSVFQIAAHEEVIHIDDLYRICEIARKILKDEHPVSRVIARPFVGMSGNYQRTENRRDFSIDPFSPTILDIMKDKELDTIGIGKIEDIFNKKGLTKADHTTNNAEGIKATIRSIKEESKGLIFVNLVDFDMLFGHRNNVEGYKTALEYFDTELPSIMEAMKEDDLLLITADHGCDPTTDSTDHSREYVPLLVWHKKIYPRDLGVRESFSDIAKTLAENFKFKIDNGDSFLRDVL